MTAFSHSMRTEVPEPLPPASLDGSLWRLMPDAPHLQYYRYQAQTTHEVEVCTWTWAFNSVFIKVSVPPPTPLPHERSPHPRVHAARQYHDDCTTQNRTGNLMSLTFPSSCCILRSHWDISTAAESAGTSYCTTETWISPGCRMFWVCSKNTKHLS